MTNVDVAALAAELSRQLVGARLDKAYQPEKDRILLRLRQRGQGRADVLCQVGRFLTVTKRTVENPDQPSMVAKILRAEFGNARLVGVSQVGFDRLLRFDFERDVRRSIVFELFGEGNMLLLDAEGVITLPMRGGDYGARRLRKGEPYVPPPGGMRPMDMDVPALQGEAQHARKDLVRFLALQLGFGPLWAEEVCLRAGLAKSLRPQELDGAQWDALHAAIQALGTDIARNDLAPALVFDTSQPEAPVDALPFTMLRYPAPRFAYEEATTFSAALDAFFVGGEEAEDDDPRTAKLAEARGRLQRQIDQMQQAIDGFAADEAARRADGDTLYAQFQQVEAVLAQLQRARQERSWQEVAHVLGEARARGDVAAQLVQDLRPHNGTALLRLADLEGNLRDVEVDLYKSVAENADLQYAAAKKARSRQDGAATALRDARVRLEEVERRGLDAYGAAPQKARRESRHFWFESYRWTVTPSGLVAVGGRNAAQNDSVVKKYLRDGDRYVHAEIHGAPSVVVRPADGAPEDVPEEDLRAACQFAACASRAWRQFGAASAYWVTPQQVSKTPRSGEFVPRGAWIVHGRRNVMANLPMRWAIGRIRMRHDGRPVPLGQDDPRAVEKLAGGPPQALEPFCGSLLLLEPGDIEPADAANDLAQRFGVDVEEVQAVLPPGPVRVVA